MSDRRGDQHPEDTPADEAEEAESPDDETLPVAGDRKGNHENNQDEIEEIAAHVSTVSSAATSRALVGSISLRHGIGRGIERRA
ncbi:hypothetical protein Sme01_59790 [Sphaerisporangium melleum]|nr:hypothetical protein Sme01_59790 [Sphaerisporangium melleum]